MIFSKRTISDLLINSVQMINNALSNAEIKEALLAYNFTEELIREGLKIHEETNNLAEDFTTNYGKKLEAGAQFREARKQAQSTFVQYVSFARILYKENPEKLVKLKIHGAIEKKITAWFFQAEQFYQAALKDDEFIVEMARFGVNKERLEEGYRLLKDAGKAKETHKSLEGKTQDLKMRRDQAINRLDDWITGFSMVCRYALVNNPQLLEELGIKVYSPGYRKKAGEKGENPENPESKEEAKMGMVKDSSITGKSEKKEKRLNK